MPAYNKEKRALFIEVDRMAAEGQHKKEQVAYHLQRKTGFSDKTILDYIKNSINAGVMHETDKGVLKRGVNGETKSDCGTEPI